MVSWVGLVAVAEMGLSVGEETWSLVDSLRVFRDAGFVKEDKDRRRVVEAVAVAVAAVAMMVVVVLSVKD
ncbi:hypothetical protein LXL04_021016 [Taraxacum kok-saghyz]